MPRARRDNLKRIHVYMLADELDYLRHYAKRKGQTMTEIIRQCVLKELRMDTQGRGHQ